MVIEITRPMAEYLMGCFATCFSECYWAGDTEVSAEELDEAEKVLLDYIYRKFPDLKERYSYMEIR